MKPAPFDYIRAESVEQAVDTLARYGEDARVLAGGQSLIAMLSMRLAQPKVLVDVSRIVDAGGIEVKDGALVIGATVTQTALQRWPDLGNTAPLLAMALPHVGHFQTRNKGTVCGSIAHADPSSELPLCLAVLGGTALIARKGARRTVAAHEIFAGILQTACSPTEMITHLRLPLAQPGDGYAFHEMAIRHGDFAIVAVAVKATANAIRIGIGGAADKPHVREWSVLDGSALDDALNALAWELDFQEDQHASARYRRHLVRTLGRRAVREALERRTHV